ncbi:MAG: GAF domain-containing protein, partial [Candidatus Omnitrophica bacterium]|nr:GAF domain-containing protein [Candidatus Omnitrophota bacterium]
MSPYSIPPLIGAIFSILIGFFVLSKNRHSQNNLSFFFFCLSVFVWLFGYTIVYSTQDATLALFFCRVACAGACFTAPAFYHFSVSFLDLKKERRFVLLAYLTMGLIASFSLVSPYFLSGTWRYYWGYYSKAGLLHPIYLVIFFGMFGRGFYLLSKEIIKGGHTRTRKLQLQYVFIAYVIALMGAIDYIPKYGVEFYPFGFTLEILFLFIVAYAILRYRLLDINVVMTRMALFAVVYIPLLVLPVFAGKLLQSILASHLGANWWVVPMGLEAIFAVVGLASYKYVQQRAENRLLAEQRRYQQLLVAAAEDMLKILDLQKLLRRIVGIVVRHVKLTFAVLYLQERDGEPYELKVSRGQKVELVDSFDSDNALIHYLWAAEGPVVAEELRRSIQEGHDRRFAKLSDRLSYMKAAVVIPSFLKTRLIGFMVLGQKISGQMFTQDDLSTFSSLAHQVAIAIQNARFHRKGVNLGKLEAADEQLSAIGHEMGNVLHIGVVQVGVLCSNLEGSLAVPPKEKLVENL